MAAGHRYLIVLDILSPDSIRMRMRIALMVVRINQSGHSKRLLTQITQQ